MNDNEPRRPGKGRPPVATRFPKGQSGNPKGRPIGSKRQPPYETVLGRKVTVREEGAVRQMTAAEAFLLHVTRQGLGGDSAAARAAMTAIEEARARRVPIELARILRVALVSLFPGSVTEALIDLRGATTLDPNRPTARVVIEPWLIEMAMDRLGDKRFTFAEQETVWKSARTPWKVQWPEWWEYHGA